MTQDTSPFPAAPPGPSPYMQALEHYKQGRFQQAGEGAAMALQSEPHNAQLWRLAGTVAKELDRFDEAERCFRAALELDPASADAHFNLGILAQEKHSMDQAAQHYRAALTRPAWHPRALNNLSVVRLKEGHAEEALQLVQQALALAPNYGKAHHNRGRALTVLGRFAEAQRAFESALALLPETARAQVYRNLVAIKRLAPGDPILLAMEQLAQRMESLPADSQMELNYALGTVYSSQGEHARAFPHFLAGNREKRRRTEYDEAATLATLERVRDAYSAEQMGGRRGVGFNSKVPIFIVGMPRSGSTLVEQILSSHPDVHGAGERNELNQLVTDWRCPDGSALWPDGIAGLPDEDLRQLGQRYVQSMQALSPNAPRITDKALHNFERLGLIHLALPQARIIHTRRDPVETCLSCFTHLFAGELSYTYDLAELGRYWRAYDRLMAHWRRVLPASAFLEVSYETLVDDLEAETRRLLDHCGLAWNPACLAFHRSTRPVHTSSVSQVRQPLYRSSMTKSRAYGDLLEPLIEALQGG